MHSGAAQHYLKAWFKGTLYTNKAKKPKQKKTKKQKNKKNPEIRGLDLESKLTVITQQGSLCKNNIYIETNVFLGN